MRARAAVGAVVAWAGVTVLLAETPRVPVVEAVKAGDRQAVAALLGSGQSANAREPDGTTALHWAVRADSFDIAQILLKAGARAGAANRYGVTPLALAATNGNAPMIDLLVRSGANPSTASPEGETVLMTAAYAGSVEALRVLVRHGADVNAREGWLGETALMWAASENHADAVRVLVEAGAEVDARSGQPVWPKLVYPRLGLSNRTDLPRGGWTALMYAARDGAGDGVRGLLDAGASLDVVDADGATPLALAIINAHYDIATYLLDKGANPNIADSTGMAPLYAAVDMNTLPPMNGRPAPVPSGRLNSMDMIAALLARGADPNARLTSPILRRHHRDGDQSLGEGTTPLMRAAKTGDVAAMRLLLEHGADPMLRQANGATVLMFAAGLGRRVQSDDGESEPDTDGLEAVTLALAAGVDANATTRTGDTALHAASTPEIVRAIAARGARLDLKNKQGQTPLEAARARRPHLVATFESLTREPAAPAQPADPVPQTRP